VITSVEITQLGAGAAQTLSAGSSGQVVVASSRATYVRTQHGLVALTPPGTYPGPLHALLSRTIPRFAAGTPIHVDRACVAIGDQLLLNLVDAADWRGYMPQESELAAARPVASKAAASVATRSSLFSEPWARATTGWESAVAAGDVELLASLVGGVGPGLTPSGDDVLAGTLLVARLLWGEPSSARLVRCAAGCRSSDLAVAFLLWAAQGQSLGPVHDLFRAAVEGRPADALECAQRLGEVGASSGADLCLGIARALESLPVT
jgi:Protein of unknown function (DUF2877)